MKNWRNPFEFYEIDDDDPRRTHDLDQTSQFTSREIMMILENIHCIDVDLLKHIMFRYLKSDACAHHEDFEIQVKYLLHNNPEALEKKRDILMKILSILIQEIQTRKSNNIDEIGWKFCQLELYELVI